MTTIFWDKNILLLEYHPVGVNTIQNSYEQMLKVLQATICRKHLEVRGKDIIFQNDNATSHNGMSNQGPTCVFWLGNFWPPRYSLDLTLNGFFLCSQLKKWRDGHQFTTDAQVKNTVKSFSHNNHLSFFQILF